MKKAIAIILFLAGSVSWANEPAATPPKNNPTGDIEVRVFGKNLGHTSTANHYFLNILVGGITGGGFGFGTSYVAYSNQNDFATTTAPVYAGIGFILGSALGVFSTILERSERQQFTYSRRIWEASWYGALFGGILGGVVGLFPYSSSKDEADILNFGGLGIGAGVITAVTLYFLLEKQGPRSSKTSFDMRWVKARNPGVSAGTVGGSFDPGGTTYMQSATRF